MTDKKLTYDEFQAWCLKDIPENLHAQWLAENSIEQAPYLDEGWIVRKRGEGTPLHNPDDYQDYEHAREAE